MHEGAGPRLRESCAIVELKQGAHGGGFEWRTFVARCRSLNSSYLSQMPISTHIQLWLGILTAFVVGTVLQTLIFGWSDSPAAALRWLF